MNYPGPHKYRVTIGLAWSYSDWWDADRHIKEIEATCVEITAQGALVFYGASKQPIYGINAGEWVTFSREKYVWPTKEPQMATQWTQVQDDYYALAGGEPEKKKAKK